jgi:hypothetical protein
MGLYKADAAGGFVHADAEELARKLQEGDGILWSGDPRLELRLCKAEAPKSMWYSPLGRRVKKGEVLARRYEVWRHNEDGTDTQIGHWRLEEFDRILMDIAPMRMDSPGHVDSLAAVDAANDAHERVTSDRALDHMMEAGEHMAKLIHDTTGPRNVFRGIPGLRDTIIEAANKPKADASADA